MPQGQQCIPVPQAELLPLGRLSLPLAVLWELWGLRQPPAGPELAVIFELVVGLLELLVVVVEVGLDLNSELVGVQPALLVVGAAVAGILELAPVGGVLSITPPQAVAHLISSAPLQQLVPPVIVTQSVVMSVSPLMGFMAAAAGMVIMRQVGLAVLAAAAAEVAVVAVRAVMAVLAAVVAVVVTVRAVMVVWAAVVVVVAAPAAAAAALVFA